MGGFGWRDGVYVPSPSDFLVVDDSVSDPLLLSDAQLEQNLWDSYLDGIDLSDENLTQELLDEGYERFKEGF